MLGKVKSSVIVIYMTIGLFYILLNIRASSTYMRPKRQMWSVDHPAIVLYRQHPSAMRKFYWYNNRTPILVGKMRLKNYMRNVHMLPRYVHSPTQYHEAYANSKRSVFRDLNNFHGFKTTSTPATTVDYVAAPVNTIEYSTGPVSPPVDFKTHSSVNSFVPLTARTLSNAERVMGVTNQWNQSDYSNDIWKKCTENCFKNSIQDFAKDQYSSHSMTSELPVTTSTTLPYFNYVAHTYFTLDDVILPHSASKFGKSSTQEQHEFRPSLQVFTTEVPQVLFTERFEHSTQPIPTTTTTTTTKSALPSKTTLFDIEYSTRPNLISSTTSATATTSTESSLFENIPSWTTPQPIKNNFSTTNVTTQSFKNRLKSMKATKNFSSNIETKLKLLKLHLKNLVTTKETPKNIQNLTASSTVVIDSNTTLPDSTTPTPVTRRTNVNRKFRKLRVLASTKKVPIQITRNSTKSINVKAEHKKSKRIYQRRKHLNSTVSPEPTKNTTIDNESMNKFKRRASTSTRKSTNADENGIVRNSTKSINHAVAKSRADGITEEKSALVTESAIMTISSGNMKMRQSMIKVKSKQHSARKINHLENDNFIPSLPIEVYFKKVNQQ
ncbi:cell wall protein DAN4 [Drosophila rhopaloa]|uniref:Cell wall protein DAN4 n=1 Tax=Drosophila rhopaloa TaxID=1041015 RepID=A0A6P4FLN9_DRORH|nr:cell wall protein DAN4 [Drosophila rhopaloa]